MKVREMLENKTKQGTLHMALIDPAKQTPDKSGEIALAAYELGSDAIMVGGSTGVTNENLDQTVAAIKANAKLPVIYFPSGANAMSQRCDAIFFMSMLNSRSVRMVMREQVAGAPFVKKLGIEPVSMGYIIVAPGMKVGEVGEADVIPREDSDLAASYALTAEYMGMSVVYLEAGSGAPLPVPEDMIRKVRETISVPLIVGGGIRTAESAAKARNAGASVVVTGTAVESSDFRTRLESIIDAVKK